MNTTELFCRECDYLHRVPSHLLDRDLCCVDCGGGLGDQKDESLLELDAISEPEGSGHAWLKHALPYLATAVVTGMACVFKLSLGRPVAAAVSGLLCFLACMRVAVVYSEHQESEDEWEDEWEGGPAYA